ncbi:SDR family oxidoreductase [Devosia sp. 1566]|uniref:SDR family oxidoreductase n=1 Tax=Devosia sp. 1566 TaxID=2499144 RepID=UPI000FDB483C|nr:SDR family oxidoreductase [Devosia sp. 1566]
MPFPTRLTYSLRYLSATAKCFSWKGAFHFSREFTRRRRDAEGAGKIINITCVHEAIRTPGLHPLALQKGLLTFTRSVALEVADLRTNVNAIAPGLIRTLIAPGP